MVPQQLLFRPSLSVVFDLQGQAAIQNLSALLITNSSGSATDSILDRLVDAARF
jgi:hypothetical protein